MWVLETDGDIFQGKRLWLRPGKRFVFGRAKSTNDDFAISDKTISRQHLLVEIEHVHPDDCGNHKTRSKVKLMDLGTKIGTTLNGEQIKNVKDENGVVGKVSHPLTQEVNVVTIGRYPHEFRIVWVPVNFTFSFGSKEQKANPWTRLHGLLGPLDIKVLHDYQVGITTHLAAKKRNTAKGLQALIDGKPIVDSERYVQALVDAGSSTDGPSLMEQDFGAHFPDPVDYLPSRGDEPTQRDATAYSPDSRRKEMFSGYTFVFYEQKQHDSLADPINLGGGKAICRVVVPDKTEVLEFVQYVKGVAGEKGLGEFEDGSEGKGVVVVRYNPAKGPGTDWYKRFSQQVSLQLDHRFIEQNEFLDAILGVDASVLRRPLEEDQASAGVPPSTGTVKSSDTLRSSARNSVDKPVGAPVPTQSQVEMAPPTQPTRGRRRAVVSKFKGFDDDDDEFAFTPPSSIQNSMDVDPAPAPTPSNEPESQGLFLTQVESQGMFVTQQSQHISPPDNDAAMDERPNSPTPPPGRTSNPRKRAAPADDDDDFINKMAPAAAAAKKRRLHENADRRGRGIVSPLPKVEIKKDPEPEVPVAKPKKKVRSDEDFLETARSTVDKATARAREEREALEKGLEGMDISEVRKLVKVEDMQITRTNPPPRVVPRADESDRWNDQWNGRKNFKKFKRRGGEDGPRHRPILVKLTEAKKRDFGIGEGYWIEPNDKTRDAQRRKKKGKERDVEEISESPHRDSGRVAGKAAQIPAEDEEVNEASSSDLEVMAKPAARKAAAAKSQPVSQRSSRAQSQTLADKTNKSQNMPTSSAGTKRAAATTLTKPAPAKKAKQVFAREDSDDSDDDGLAFKFKR